MARLLQEPLDVGTGQAVERVEAEQRVLAHDGASGGGRGEDALLPRDVLGLALELGQVQGAVADGEGQRRAGVEDGRHLLEFFGVAGDEGELRLRRERGHARGAPNAYDEGGEAQRVAHAPGEMAARRGDAATSPPAR